MASNVYRRSAIYWWRRNFTFRNGRDHPITVRMSLKTAAPEEARTRAAVLEAHVEDVKMMLRAVPQVEDFQSMARRAFDRALNRYTIAQMTYPQASEQHARANLAYSRYFSLVAASANSVEATEELRADLRDRGLAENEIDQLWTIARTHEGQPAVSARQLFHDLEETGLEPTDQNARIMSRVVAAGYAQACLKATEAMGLPSRAEHGFALPAALTPLFPDYVAPTINPSVPIAPAVLARSEMTPGPAGSSASSSGAGRVESTNVIHTTEGRIDVRIKELAAKALEREIADGNWDSGRRRDIDAAVNLFVHANGNLFCSEIHQRHLADMKALFSSLPTRYGHTKEDREGGLGAALARGAMLKEIWKHDPAKAEQEQLGSVGLGAVTCNKHLTWMSALRTWADANGYVIPSYDPKLLRSKGAKGAKKVRKRDKRPNWDLADLRKLLSGPIWEGCADLWRRFEPGNQMFHDGAYWLPLFNVTGGPRSSESAGMSIQEVIYEEEIEGRMVPVAIPHFSLQFTKWRRLKTTQSIRKIPIHPKLIELGFIEYVKEIKALGHDLCFPELYNENGLSFSDTARRKIMEPLMNHHFPDGTSRLRKGKDVDTHAIRGTATAVLRDAKVEKFIRLALFGWEGEDEDEGTYPGEVPLDLILPSLDHLTPLVDHVERKPLNLRPAEWQRFGSPRGRPRKC